MEYIDLPVYHHRDRILQALENNQVIVVESPAGSGKTTGLPLILYEAGYSGGGIIGVSQPRRIAAVSVSEFIARQMGMAIPGIIGYKMRFEDQTNARTKIKIMTDGILLQELKLDPWLSKYSVLVIDEAHERNLNIDFILGLLKRILESRDDFKVIVSSATINAEIFSVYFNECPIVKIDAQRFPVTLIYDPIHAAAAEKPRIDAASGAVNAVQVMENELLSEIESIITGLTAEKQKGDVLVFLPGEKMIKDCINTLAMSPFGKSLFLLPLYGRLGKEEQERVFEKTPKGKIKVVVATNIAETSITIDGITTVIDSGLSKLNWYNPKTFTSSLIESPISKASANQRKGRAGRTCEGTCYRLYSRKDYECRPLFTIEEIFRTDLSEVVLRMADLGLSNFEDFDFISMPSKPALRAAIETLNLLEALESDRSLTSTGKLMTEFPLAPRQSRIIIEAIMRYPDVIRETLIAAAFLSTQSPYVLPLGEESDARRAHHNFRDDAGDFVSYLKLFSEYSNARNQIKFCEKNYLDARVMSEITNVVAQLEEILGRMKIPVLSGGKKDDYLCCVGRGMVQFVCEREGKGKNTSYRSLTAEKIIIHPGSVMFRMDPQYIVAGEIIKTTRMYAMSVSPLTRELVHKIKSGLFTDAHAHPAAAVRGSRAKISRDFTNAIKIADEVFEIITIKNKKTVMLPWEKLSAIKDRVPAETVYKGMKGCIIYNGKYKLMAGEKLDLILRLAGTLDPENSLLRKLPGEKNYHFKDNRNDLLRYLDALVTPALMKSGKELGFFTMFTNGNGSYWFKSSRGFHTSLSESLSSLDSLIDEFGDTADTHEKYILNQCYRRLSDILGE
ncbi:MAG: ATP-dependent RNA helicase [Treponema sp.]|nr:ATP-dependent RNA helicase [Treponema sp.]